MAKKKPMGRGRPPHQRQSTHISRAYEGPKGTTVFIENLPFRCNWYELKTFFSQAGSVVVADIFFDRDGLSKGCGVVRFESPEEAQNAVDTLNGTELNGRSLTVRIDAQADKFRDGISVHVSNLPYYVTWKELKDAFRPMGELMHAEVIEDANGRSRGWGLVRFNDAASAQNAIDQLDGYTMGDRQIAVRLDKGRQAPREEETEEEVAN